MSRARSRLPERGIEAYATTVELSIEETNGKEELGERRSSEVLLTEKTRRSAAEPKELGAQSLVSQSKGMTSRIAYPTTLMQLRSLFPTVVDKTSANDSIEYASTIKRSTAVHDGNWCSMGFLRLCVR